MKSPIVMAQIRAEANRTSAPPKVRDCSTCLRFASRDGCWDAGIRREQNFKCPRFL